MAITNQQFALWLKNPTAIRCILVEVDVKVSGGGDTTRYLSNAGYVTGSSDVPANTIYSPVISGGVKFNESIDIDGSVSLSWGDIELNNFDGSLDSWLNDYWTNRSIRVYIGDTTWPRADFQQIFNGVVTGIDTRKRDTINIKLSDKLQRLNTPVTEAKLGGSTTNADATLPLLFGECHNIEPLLVDQATHEYQIHQGPIEAIIEVRDNGVPVSFTPLLSTGKFRLVAQPVGQITCSAQGFVGTNKCLQSQTLDSSSWNKAGASISANATTAPDGTTTADKIVESALNEAHSCTSPGNITTTANVPITLSTYAKAAGRSQVRLAISAASFGGSTTAVVFDISTGAVVSNSSTSVTARIVGVGNGWYRCSITRTPTTTLGTAAVSTNPCSGATFTYAGDGSSGIYVWGTQVEDGDYPGVYGPTTTTVANTYSKTPAQIIKLLATKYGTAATRFTGTDLDWASIEAFDTNNYKFVGLYLKDRANVLEACNQLASSLGASLVMSKTGLLSLVKLSLPQGSAGTTVTNVDMVDRSLEVSRMPQVVAGVKMGYCKNWTVQDTLAGGVLEEHASMFKEEWLTTTATDSAAAANFNLYSDPNLTESLLLTAADALAEANRRLAIFSVQRKVMKYKGYANLLTEVLGSPQTIRHSRFGLGAGVTGQIIGISTDWINQRVEIEVLI